MIRIKEALIEARKIALSKNKSKQFGYLLLTVVLATLVFSVYKNGLIFNACQLWLFILVILISCVTVFYSRLFYPFLFIWMLFGVYMGMLVSIITLMVIYYLIISPVAVFWRFRKKKAMEESGWIDKKNTINYKKLF
jgi:hypothetical protein